MDRLTLTKEQREMEGVTYAKYFAPELCQKFDKRLAAYEDTGFTPDQITAAQAENAELKARLDKAVELPCKLQSTVYWVGNYRGKIRIVEYRVEDITIFKGGDSISYFLSCGRTIQFFKSDIGKTVFLTREAAESALKEREKEAEK